METTIARATPRAPWNKGKLTGQKPPLKLCEIWAIRTRLQISKPSRARTIQSCDRWQASSL